MENPEDSSTDIPRLKQVAGELSQYASVVTDPSGTGLRMCVVLDDGDYVEYVLHTTECIKLFAILKEALVDGSGKPCAADK